MCVCVVRCARRNLNSSVSQIYYNGCWLTQHSTARYSSVVISKSHENLMSTQNFCICCDLFQILGFFFVLNWTHWMSWSLAILNTVSFHQNTTIGIPNTSRLLLLHLIYLSPVYCYWHSTYLIHTCKNLECKYICTHKSTSFRTNLWSNSPISILFSFVS